MRNVIVVEIFAGHGSYRIPCVVIGLRAELGTVTERVKDSICAIVCRLMRITLSLYPARYRSRFCNGASRSITVITNLRQMTTQAVSVLHRGFLSSGQEQYFHSNCRRNFTTD